MLPSASCTDHFRAENAATKCCLDEIDVELNHEHRTGSPSTCCDGASKLLILLERDFLRAMDEEEHLLYTALGRQLGSDDATLQDCYQDHGDIRTGVDALHRELHRVRAGAPEGAEELRASATTLIARIRNHMMLEETILFPRAELLLPPSVLARLDASVRSSSFGFQSPNPSGMSHPSGKAQRS